MTKTPGARTRSKTIGKRDYAELKRRERALADARKGGDADKIKAAVQRVRETLSIINSVNVERFENLVQYRGDTAVRAIEELEKLCRQRRYQLVITKRHSDAIVRTLTEAMESLQRVIDAALATQQAPLQARRSIDFGTEQPSETAANDVR